MEQVKVMQPVRTDRVIGYTVSTVKMARYDFLAGQCAAPVGALLLWLTFAAPAGDRVVVQVSVVTHYSALERVVVMDIERAREYFRRNLARPRAKRVGLRGILIPVTLRKMALWHVDERVRRWYRRRIDVGAAVYRAEDVTLTLGI